MTRDRTLQGATEPRVRRAGGADAAAIAGIYRPHVEATPVSFELEPPGEAEMAQRIGAVSDRFPWLVVEVAGAVEGYAYAGTHRARPAYQWSVETAIYVASGARGRSHGRRLYRALLDILRLLGYHRAWAGITLPNPASVALHEAFGFEQLGVFSRVGYKFGAWHDVGWWGLPLQEGTPAPPLPMSAVVGTPAWNAILTAE